MPEPRHTLSKAEKVCGKTDTSRLIKNGVYRNEGCIRYCYLPSEAEVSRILVSVPKRNFKRAVKRNLLKRRIREAYRLNKEILTAPVDILFIYTASAVLPFKDIEQAVCSALSGCQV